MDTIFGGLIEFESQREFNTFVNKMTKEDSMKIIELALEYGTKTGLFSMEENVAIYNSLQNLKTDENKESDLRDVDNHGDTN
jgi:homoaconitase/3-isopropylmalate dehydratase large subunit